MDAILLVLAAIVAAAAVTMPDPARSATVALAGPRRTGIARRVLAAMLVLAVLLPAALVLVLVAVHPSDAPLRFVHGCLALGYWMAATTLGVDFVGGARGRPAVATVIAVAAAVVVTSFDRFAAAFPGQAAILAAGVAILLIASAGAGAGRRIGVTAGHRVAPRAADPGRG